MSGRNNIQVGKRTHERAEKLFLHYSQRWAKDYLRRRLDWVMEDLYGRQDYSSNTNPRHITSALCPCQVNKETSKAMMKCFSFSPFQYIEEHLKNKRQRESLNPFKQSLNPCYWCD